MINKVGGLNSKKKKKILLNKFVVPKKETKWKENNFKLVKRCVFVIWKILFFFLMQLIDENFHIRSFQLFMNRSIMNQFYNDQYTY